MNPEAYFERMQQHLTGVFGMPRKTPTGIAFGDIGLEFECIGSTMLIFLSTLNWMRYASWDGAVHIDMQHDTPQDAARCVQEMMQLGRRRVGKH